MLPEYRVTGLYRLPPLLPAPASPRGRLEDRARAFEDHRARCGARAVPRWLYRYNARRPHGGIGGAVPTSRL